MKKLMIAVLVLWGCSDDATPTAQNNLRNDAGMDTGLQADLSSDASTSSDASDTGTVVLPDAGSDATADVGNDTTDRTYTTDPLGGDRPVDPSFPTAYNPNVAAPLLIVLHGYGATGAIQTNYMRFKDVQDEHGFIMLSPDGMRNTSSQQFWNASDYCCDFENTQVDDVSYIAGLIEEAKERFFIDEKRVFLVGHSNGGFMSYRMACEKSELISGIVSLAGAMPTNTSACQPTEPVAVAQVHGTADAVILYGGQAPVGQSSGYPSAPTSVAFWRNQQNCDATESARDAIDISSESGAETDVTYWNNCDGNGAVELWTMNFAPHIPGLNAGFPEKVLEFLMGHPKP